MTFISGLNSFIRMYKNFYNFLVKKTSPAVILPGRIKTFVKIIVRSKCFTLKNFQASKD